MLLDGAFFRPLPAAERRTIPERFVRYSMERFGEPDFAARTFTKREAYMRAFRARPKPRWKGEPIAQDDFDAWYHGRRSIADAPPLARWLVRVARADVIEAWGIDYHLTRSRYQDIEDRARRVNPRSLATLQEVYHGPMLQEVVRLFGLDFEIHLPGGTMRQVFKMSSYLPPRIAFPLTLVTEIIGAVGFIGMLERAETLVAEDPETLALARELLDDLIADELGHVGVLLGMMDPAQMWTVRGLTPLITRKMGRLYHGENPEDAAQSRRGVEMFSFALFPERIRKQAFIPEQYLENIEEGAAPPSTWH